MGPVSSWITLLVFVHFAPADIALKVTPQGTLDEYCVGWEAIDVPTVLPNWGTLIPIAQFRMSCTTHLPRVTRLERFRLPAEGTYTVFFWGYRAGQRVVIDERPLVVH